MTFCRSLDGHRIVLFHCHQSLTLGQTLVQLWCWMELPSGRRWWACWRLETSHYSVNNVLVNKKSHAMLKFIFFSTEENLPLLLFHQKSSISFSQSPKMFHLYLSISCVSSRSFPAALSVLLFHVLIVMLSLPQSFDGAPVACLTPLSWCTAEGPVLVNPVGKWSGMVWLLVSLMVTQGQSKTWQSPSLSGSNMLSLSLMWNLFAHLALVFKLWRHPPSDVVLTTAISPIKETHAGQEHITPSCTGPKDLPTARKENFTVYSAHPTLKIFHTTDF